jgi:hypothetical protein
MDEMEQHRDDVHRMRGELQALREAKKESELECDEVLEQALIVEEESERAKAELAQAQAQLQVRSPCWCVGAPGWLNILRVAFRQTMAASVKNTEYKLAEVAAGRPVSLPAASGGGLDAPRSRCERRRVGPEVGPTPACYSCAPTGMHGPTCIFWAT